MIKKILLIVLLLAGISYGDATPYNINNRPTSDWFSGLDSFRNIPLQWMRAIDPLVAASSSNPGTGSIFYVDSGVTTAGGGTSWASAVATLDEAVNLCTANRGDIIYVAQGHNEALTGADGVDIDIAGVTVIGLGNGSDRPRFDYDAGAGEFVIGAAGVRIVNLTFLPSADSVVHAIDVEDGGDYAVIQDCEFLNSETANTDEFDDVIQVGTTATDVWIINCTHTYTSTSVECNSFVDLSAATILRPRVIGCYAFGGYDEAPIWGGAAVPTQVIVANNYVYNSETGDLGIEFQGAATGFLSYNIVYTDALATAIDPGSLTCVENYAINTTDLSAVRVPVDPALSAQTHTAGSANDILEKLYYGADGTGAFPATVANDSTIAKILASGATATASTYDNTTDSLQAISDAVSALSGVGLRGTCATDAGGAQSVTSTELTGFGNDYFNTGWTMTVLYDSSAAGSAPEGEIRDITDYVSATGVFTVSPAFSAQVTLNDEVYLRRYEEHDNTTKATLHGGSGNVFYVDSGQAGTPSTAETGLTWDGSFATIAAAIAGATADNGDVIYVAAGHSETIGAAQIALNVAGVDIIGLGRGDQQPTLVFDDASSSVDVSAADILIQNIKFETSTDNVLIAIDIAGGADGLHIKDCAFVSDAATDEFLEAIEFGAAAADDVTIEGCFFASDSTAAATEAIISETGASDNTQIIGNTFIGDWSVSAIWSNQVHTNMLVKDNIVYNNTTGQHAIELTGAATGMLVGNRMHGDTITAILDPGSLLCTNNIGSISINEQGFELPTSADTSGITEEDDGSVIERLEALQNMTTDALARLGQSGIDVGDVFFVDSVTGNGADDATTWALAEATIDGAIDLCTANVGDTIIVAPGHTETFTAADSFDADQAGINIIGLGRGTNAPLLLFNHANAEVVVGADNVVIQNIRFASTITGVSIGMDIEANADYTLVKDCTFIDEGDNIGTDEFLIAVRIGNACIGTRIENCKFQARAAGAQSAINFTDDTDQTEIIDCDIQGDYAVACIDSSTANAAQTNMLIKDNILVNGSLVGDGGLNAVAAMSMLDASSGLVTGNLIASDVATALLMTVADDFVFMNNYVTDDDGDEFDGGARNSAASVGGHTDG